MWFFFIGCSSSPASSFSLTNNDAFSEEVSNSISIDANLLTHHSNFRSTGRPPRKTLISGGDKIENTALLASQEFWILDFNISDIESFDNRSDNAISNQTLQTDSCSNDYRSKADCLSTYQHHVFHLKEQDVMSVESLPATTTVQEPSLLLGLSAVVVLGLKFIKKRCTKP